MTLLKAPRTPLSTDQDAYCTYHECSLMLGTDKVKAENALVGGGFGGKEDMTVQHHAALLTYVTRRPVKVKLTRAESGIVGVVGSALDVDVLVLVGPGGVGAGALQHRPAQGIEGTAYYTNNPPAGAFRGFGVTQTCFAVESLINELADKAGLPPWEMRFRNAIRPGLPSWLSIHRNRTGQPYPAG